MDAEIKQQLDRIEQYAMIAAKSMLNIHEASFILGMTEQGVRLKVKQREIPCYKPNVNRLYFKKSELEDWMQQNRSQTQEELEAQAEIYCQTH